MSDLFDSGLAAFRLAWPLALGFLALPGLQALLAGRGGRVDRAVAAIRLPFAASLPLTESADRQSAPMNSGPRWRGLSAIHLIAYTLLVLAAARPQWIAEVDQRPVSGRDLLIVLDVSLSMLTRDLRADGENLTRLDASTRLARRFLERRPGDRVGLLVFGSRPYLYTPLSYDQVAVGQALQSVAAGLAGPETALGDAVGLAVRTLGGGADDPAALGSKVAILISDGANTRGALAPEQASWLAAQRGVRVHALGIGAAPDAPTLKALAEQGGGHYARATDAAAVAAFFDAVDALEPAVRASLASGARGRDLYPLPLALGLLLIAGASAWPRARSRAR